MSFCESSSRDLSSGVGGKCAAGGRSVLPVSLVAKPGCSETGVQPVSASATARPERPRAEGEGTAAKVLTITTEIFLTILTGLIFAVAFLHLVIGILELAALLALIGAVFFASVLRLELRRQGF